MGKYTSDDNRSMQLNENNDRYYSSRGIDRFDDGDCDAVYAYQMQTAEINRQTRMEYDRAKAAHMGWACPTAVMRSPHMALSNINSMSVTTARY